jgi:hypothetical protein
MQKLNKKSGESGILLTGHCLLRAQLPAAAAVMARAMVNLGPGREWSGLSLFVMLSLDLLYSWIGIWIYALPSFI